VNNSENDERQDDDLPRGETLPVRLEDLDNLAERPRPDELNKAEDRSNALLQKLHNLIDCLIHVRLPRLAPTALYACDDRTVAADRRYGCQCGPAVTRLLSRLSARRSMPARHRPHRTDRDRRDGPRET